MGYSANNLGQMHFHGGHWCTTCCACRPDGAGCSNPLPPSIRLFLDGLTGSYAQFNGYYDLHRLHCGCKVCDGTTSCTDGPIWGNPPDEVYVYWACCPQTGPNCFGQFWHVYEPVNGFFLYKGTYDPCDPVGADYTCQPPQWLQDLGVNCIPGQENAEGEVVVL
jgi:hypothetical protein